MDYPIGAHGALAKFALSPRHVDRRTGVKSAPQAFLSLFREHRQQCDGNAILEFALIAPMMLALLVGIVWLGVLLNNYITLTDAVSQGARAFAEATGVSGTPVNGDPCTYAITVMNADAKSLKTANITYTISYTPEGGTATAETAPCTGIFSGMQEGDTVTIQATYPALMPGTTLGSSGFLMYTHLTSWTLNAHDTQVVQ